MDRVLTHKIKDYLKDDRIILIIGQRQVGKTSELKRYFGNENTKFFDFEDELSRRLFHTPSVDVLESIIGNKEETRILLLDEIQYLPKSGSILKLLHDHFPNTKVIATGSASFLLLKDIGDSLYGRNVILNMYPLTFREIVSDSSNFAFELGEYNLLINRPKIDANLNNILIYGSLPKIFLEQDISKKKELLDNYLSSLLFKDVFEIEGIRLPQAFKKLLSLLALQIGSEVNTNELARQIGTSRDTVLEYIALYEKFKIIYTLSGFSNNPRKEITKNFKVYFNDLGIRNTLINNYNLPDLRNDTGALFENLVINTFQQNIDYYRLPYKLHFWRTYSKAEVDIVITSNSSNEIIPVEIKYSRVKAPSKSFVKEYGDRITKTFTINKENFWQFI